MKKNQYIAPATLITKVTITSHLMQYSATSISGLEGVTLSSDEFKGGAADVKQSYNVWDDDWSE
jgi:hypothetical protein